MKTGFGFLVNVFARRQRLKITPPPPRADLTLAQWREREDLVAHAKRLQSDPFFRLQIEVLTNESPVNYHNPAQSAERALGQIEGYNIALNNLAALAIPPGERITLEATFEPEK